MNTQYQEVANLLVKRGDCVALTGAAILCMRRGAQTQYGIVR
jgi:hypothetical protein